MPTAPPNAVHSKSLGPREAKDREKESKIIKPQDSIAQEMNSLHAELVLEFCLVKTFSGDVRFNFSEDPRWDPVTVLIFSLHMPTRLWSPSSAISGNIQCQCTLEVQVSLSVQGHLSNVKIGQLSVTQKN